eukprot:GGOE01014755.1.p1 GENE.GGOE01014755.1~~GGOE01014755.1.p1  ORF type:complete len:415 (+),score=55.08 GGOE01014755.1:22-1245(+)
MYYGGYFDKWTEEGRQKHRCCTRLIGPLSLVVASYFILFSPLSQPLHYITPPLLHKAVPHVLRPVLQAHPPQHRIAFLAPLYSSDVSIHKEAKAEVGPDLLTSDNGLPDGQEKLQGHGAPEEAGLIHVLNTLFKIALLSQFLEYGLSPFTRDMLAGACAALVSIVFLFPIDTMKTRQQLPVPLSQKWGLYKGWLYGVLRECPTSALYIAGFHAARNLLLSHNWLPVSGIGVSLSAVVMATLLASVFRVPFEVMTKRAQAGMSSEKASPTFKGQLFSPASWLVVEMRDIFYNVLQLVLFRYLQIPIIRVMQPFLPELPQRLACGLLAGAGAAVATAPLDVAATRTILMDEEQGPPPRLLLGTLARLRLALSTAFVGKAPWLGNRLRMLYSALSTCVFFYLVEAFRAAL